MKDFSVRRRVYSAVKYVMMMMRKKAAMKRLQGIGLGFYTKRLRFYDRVLSGPQDHYQFSCSSTPVKRDSSKWGHVRSLLGCINSGDIRTLSFSLSFPRMSIQNSPHCISDDNNGNVCVEVDVEAEEFIAKFYEQMGLQRQDSYVKYQEMLARGMTQALEVPPDVAQNGGKVSTWLLNHAQSLSDVLDLLDVFQFESTSKF